MAAHPIREELLKQLEKLSRENQEKVLDFARSLAAIPEPLRRRSGKDLLAFAGAIDRQDLAEIAKAIQEDCERIDPSAW